MKFAYILLIFLLATTLSNAQEQLNQTDKNGLKQGHWVSKYPDGQTRYDGSFADNKPIGEWKRFHENGKIKAILIHQPNSEKVVASLFDDEGTLYAKGNFVGTEKDSVWYYFNNKTIVGTENYVNGKKEGESKTFYVDGTVAREANYKNDQLDGAWREFYPSGTKKTEMVYRDGLRDGWCIVYYENGETLMEGKYLANQTDGTWKYFSDNGDVRFQLEYEKGTLSNPEIIDSLQSKEFSDFDKMRGNLTDPAQFRDNPSDLLRK